MILFGDIIRRRAALWAVYPDAPRGYFGGAQDPDEAPGAGLLTVNNVPGARVVEVRHRLSRTVVATTFASPEGAWQIGDLPGYDEYDIIARDHSGSYEDVIVAAQRPYTGV